MNKPPQTDKQAGKRIMSKGAYVKLLRNTLLGEAEESHDENTEKEITPTRIVTLAEYAALVGRKIASGLLAVVVGLLMQI